MPRRGRTDNSNETDDDDEITSDYIDTGGGPAMEFPVRLAYLIDLHHAYIVELQIQGKFRDSWRVLKTRLKLGAPPTDKSVDDLCMWICQTMTRHAQGNAPADRYKARIGVRPDGHTKTSWKTCELKPILTEDGTTAMADYAATEEEIGNSVLEEASTLVIRQMTAMVEATEGMGGITSANGQIIRQLLGMIEEIRTHYASQSEARIQEREYDLREQLARYEHERGLAKIGRLGDFLEEMGGPLGEMLQDVFSEIWGDMREEASDEDRKKKAEARAKRKAERERQKSEEQGVGPLASKYKRWYADLGDTQREAYRKVFTDDEWELIEKGRTSAKTDAEFVNLFHAMSKRLDARGLGVDDFRKQLIEALGMKGARRLGRILKEVRAKG